MIPGIILAVGAIISIWLYLRQARCLARLRSPTSSENEVARQLEKNGKFDGLNADQKLAVACSLAEARKQQAFFAGICLTLIPALTVAVVQAYGPNLLTQVPEKATALKQQGRVFVQGPDGITNQVAIPSQGLTLYDALHRMDLSKLMKSVEDDEDEGEPWFVAVRATGTNDNRTYFMPVNMANGGLASHIELRTDDQVGMINLEDTSLGVFDLPETGLKFSVGGLIERPGDYTTKEDADSFMYIATPEYAGSFETDESGPDVMIVERAIDENGPLHVFILPLVEPYLNIDLLESIINDGDSIRYVRLKDHDLLAAND